MKSEERVPAYYKKGSEDWEAEYNMLLDDGLTCKDCAFCQRCVNIYGQNETDTRCQFHPNSFRPAKNTINATPGPWQAGKYYGCVVASFMPEDGPNGAADIESYGGFLIAESIAKCNVPLISAAPELYESCLELIALANRFRHHFLSPNAAIEKAKKAIAKAEGRSEE